MGVTVFAGMIGVTLFGLVPAGGSTSLRKLTSKRSWFAA